MAGAAAGEGAGQQIRQVLQQVLSLLCQVRTGDCLPGLPLSAAGTICSTGGEGEERHAVEASGRKGEGGGGGRHTFHPQGLVLGWPQQHQGIKDAPVHAPQELRDFLGHTPLSLIFTTRTTSCRCRRRALMSVSPHVVLGELGLRMQHTTLPQEQTPW